MNTMRAVKLAIAGALLATGLHGCQVDRRREADPSEVPTASALDCTPGQFVAWTAQGWGCADAPECVLDYTVFGSCDAGEKVTGIDPETGAVQCDVDLDTDTDTLATLPCAEGQLVTWMAGGWGCADAPECDLDYTVFGSCDDGYKVTGIDAETGAVICDEDLDTPDTLASLGCGEGQIVESTGEGWACAAREICPAGTVTSISTPADSGIVLTPNPITEAGEIALEIPTIVAAAETALEGRLVPDGCVEGDVLVRGPDGWECTSDPKCPPGFGHVAEGDYDVCTRDFLGCNDVMVKVGDFWIDRYEIRAWPEGADLGGPTGGNEIREGGPNDGVTTVAAACSAANQTPQADITWFQAAQMCANAGKRLCSNAEWQTAATGTPDAGATTEDEDCNVSGDGQPAPTGEHTLCVSRFGAHDMGGNLTEWVGDWYAAAGTDEALEVPAVLWGNTYGLDYMKNISGTAYDPDSGGWGYRRPAAALRGGAWDDRTDAGVFAFDIRNAPSASGAKLGVRCCAGGGG